MLIFALPEPFAVIDRADKTPFPRHKSLIAYLTAANLPRSAAMLREELNIGDEFSEATCKKYQGLLEKKWTSVVRMQKKVNTHSPVAAVYGPKLTVVIDYGLGVIQCHSPD